MDYRVGAGSCVGNIPNLFLIVTLSFENLSSGEKRAGCAEAVGLPSDCHVSSTMKLQGSRIALTSRTAGVHTG
eukprot:scaffold514604_cov41-Prasinocladus_malaysianus.AAC.1